MQLIRSPRVYLLLKRYCKRIGQVYSLFFAPRRVKTKLLSCRFGPRSFEGLWIHSERSNRRASWPRRYSLGWSHRGVGRSVFCQKRRRDGMATPHFATTTTPVDAGWKAAWLLICVTEAPDVFSCPRSLNIICCCCCCFGEELLLSFSVEKAIFRFGPTIPRARDACSVGPVFASPPLLPGSFGGWRLKDTWGGGDPQRTGLSLHLLWNEDERGAFIIAFVSSWGKGVGGGEDAMYAETI